jgi:hypothetical protein
VQADQQVGQHRDVHDGAQLVLVEPRHRDAAAAPSSDIVSAPARRSIQPPTQLPSRSMFSPLSGGTPGTARVDHRAVVALLVVLDDDLPVRADVVLVRTTGDQ